VTANAKASFPKDADGVVKGQLSDYPLCRGLTRNTSRRPEAKSRQRPGEYGYLYQISILQAEFSLTQVLDRPGSPHRNGYQ